MLKGSCLCGKVQYQLNSEPKKVTHCHCTMCQKQHGAAFATYGSVLKNDLVYLSGEGLLSIYSSSNSIARKFCSNCGSSLEWSGASRYPGWTSIALATLDSKYMSARVDDIYEDTRACWFTSS